MLRGAGSRLLRAADALDDPSQLGALDERSQLVAADAAPPSLPETRAATEEAVAHVHHPQVVSKAPVSQVFPAAAGVLRPGKGVRRGVRYAELDYVTARDMPASHEELGVPGECAYWRAVARNETQVVPYRKHFTSLDVTDWFLYVAMFDEAFHASAAAKHRRPRYLDVAANHARRWSNTWFFDRCMGWDGVCVEANPRYHGELRRERHCHLIDTCVSDQRRTVRFSMTDAYGGVVKGEKERFGVDGGLHATAEKFRSEFHGIRELTCTTLKREMGRLGMERFDFLSLDVEGHELPILEGIDWKRARIAVIVTENRSSMVRRLLEKEGFVLYMGVLKDYVYVRKDSGLMIKDEFLRMMKRFDRRTYRFTEV